MRHMQADWFCAGVATWWCAGGARTRASTRKELSALWTIPMPYEDYPEMEAVLMTGNTQLKWIGQLAMKTIR